MGVGSPGRSDSSLGGRLRRFTHAALSACTAGAQLARTWSLTPTPVRLTDLWWSRELRGHRHSSLVREQAESVVGRAGQPGADQHPSVSSISGSPSPGRGLGAGRTGGRQQPCTVPFGHPQRRDCPTPSWLLCARRRRRAHPSRASERSLTRSRSATWRTEQRDPCASPGVRDCAIGVSHLMAGYGQRAGGARSRRLEGCHAIGLTAQRATREQSSP